VSLSVFVCLRLRFDRFVPSGSRCGGKGEGGYDLT
jgi:hypothetical protein